MGRKVKIKAGQLWITEGRKNAKGAFVTGVPAYVDVIEYGVVNGPTINSLSRDRFLSRFPTRIKGIKE